MSLSVFKKWGFRVLVVTAVLLLLIAVAVTVAADRTGDREVTPVTEPSFALNGEDYPLAPVLQDFIDRGWKLGKSTEQTGRYVEGEGPYGSGRYRVSPEQRRKSCECIFKCG